MRAYLTRDADFFVPLHVRVQKARRVQADLFVSLHADAFFTPTPAGCQRVCPEPGRCLQQAARWMANKENKADQVGGLNIKAKDAQVQARLAGHEHHGADQRQPQTRRRLLGEIGKVGKLHKPHGSSRPALPCSRRPTFPACWLKPRSSATRRRRSQRLRTDALPATLPAGRRADARHLSATLPRPQPKPLARE
jgi:N-acetylmuramoyl-L-alanine amidase